jgi:hypothetical protein
MRREKRTEIDATARLHPNDWSSLEVRVLDVSANGFRAESDARILSGSVLGVDVPGVGTVYAHVTWRRAGRFGAQFDTPIDLDRCSWTPLCRQVVLARMLIDHALANRSGAFGNELELKRKILGGLPPLKAIAGAEPRYRR